MSNVKPFTDSTAERTSPTIADADILLCGAGTDASITGPFSIGASKATTITIGRTGQTVNVAGNFSVTGESTSSTVVNMADRVIHLGATTGNVAVPMLPIGISADRGASAGTKRDMASLVWDETASRWKFCLITEGDDATLSTYQTVQALRFDAPTFGRADAGALAIGGAATSIAMGAATSASSFVAPSFGRADAGALAFGGSATSIVAAAPIAFAAAQTGTIQKRTVTVGVSGSAAEVELTTVGLAQVINLGTVLPANAMVLGVDLALTPFSGGGAGAVSGDVGTAGDDDAIVSTADLFAAAVDGKASDMPAGIAPFKLFTSAGAQLLLTITSDVNVSTLTAGQVVATVSFVALP